MEDCAGGAPIGEVTVAGPALDFFLSYAPADQAWAEWIAWVLEENGYRVLVQAWDGVPGSNKTVTMQQGIVEARRTLALLSPAYLASHQSLQWQATNAADPAGADRKLVPIRLENCPLPGLLGPIVPIDLFDRTAGDARRHLLGAIATTRQGRAKPTAPPPFPRSSNPTEREGPVFPGPASSGPVASTKPSGSGPTTLSRALPGRMLRWPRRHRISASVAVGILIFGVILARSRTPTETSFRNPGLPVPVRAGQVLSVAFSPNGRILASASLDGMVWLWDVTHPATPHLLGQAITDKQRLGVLSVAFSPDGRTLASSNQDGTSRLWDVTDPARLHPRGNALTGLGGAMHSLAFSPDGRTLAGAGQDKVVRLWDVTNPDAPRLLGQPLTGPTQWVNSVVFSPNGKTLVSGSQDRSVWRWDVANPATPRALGKLPDGMHGAILSVAFSPNGETLATSTDDRSAQLWDLTDPDAPRALGKTLSGDGHWMKSVVFSRDGRMLAGADGDGTVRLWDVTDQENPRPLDEVLTSHTGYIGEMLSVAFSPNGKILASANTDGYVSLWSRH